jgi:hypothetical protein
MPERPEDPVLRSGRREARFVMLLWVAALIYTVGYCYLFGYHRTAESLTFILGFPDWVFWGVLAPWVACILVSYWFSHIFMQDEYLGDDGDEQEVDHA